MPAFIGTFCLRTDYSWVLFGTRYPAIGGLLKISLTIPEALVVVDCGWSLYSVVYSSLMIEQFSSLVVVEEGVRVFLSS